MKRDKGDEKEEKFNAGSKHMKIVYCAFDDERSENMSLTCDTFDGIFLSWGIFYDVFEALFVVFTEKFFSGIFILIHKNICKEILHFCPSSSISGLTFLIKFSVWL